MTSIIPDDKRKLFQDFVKFARAQVLSKDIDPVYPLLKNYFAMRSIDLQSNTALWMTFLYLTWYHLGSAEKVWTKYPEQSNVLEEDVAGLKTGIERRGFRGNTKAFHTIKHLNDRGTIKSWVESFIEPSPIAIEPDWETREKRSWSKTYHAIQLFPNCGTWSAFKWCDLLKNVHDYPMTAPDIGVGGKGEKAGPIPGMVALTGLNWSECATVIDYQEQLLREANEAGAMLNGLDQLETALCDFNSLIKGSYYVGHDIDDLMTKLKDGVSQDFWTARDKTFDNRRLGEHNNYFGVQKELKSKYRDHQLIVNNLGERL